MSELTIRPAYPDDVNDLQRLAALDSATVPGGELLIAELDGVLAAAVSIDDQGVIADPFRPTAAVVDLLARWARQLRPETAGRWWGRWPPRTSRNHNVIHQEVENEHHENISHRPDRRPRLSGLGRDGLRPAPPTGDQDGRRAHAS